MGRYVCFQPAPYVLEVCLNVILVRPVIDVIDTYTRNLHHKIVNSYSYDGSNQYSDKNRVLWRHRNHYVSINYALERGLMVLHPNPKPETLNS